MSDLIEREAVMAALEKAMREHESDCGQTYGGECTGWGLEDAREVIRAIPAAPTDKGAK